MKVLSLLMTIALFVLFPPEGNTTNNPQKIMKQTPKSKKKNCISPFEDIKVRTGNSPADEYLLKKHYINLDRFEDYLIIEKNSCNNHGCNNFIYLSQDPHCFKFAGEFSGEIKIIENKKGDSTLQIAHPPSLITSELKFDSIKQVFEEARR